LCFHFFEDLEGWAIKLLNYERIKIERLGWKEYKNIVFLCKNIFCEIKLTNYASSSSRHSERSEESPPMRPLHLGAGEEEIPRYTRNDGRGVGMGLAAQI
jgi:hypothetical protein